MESTSFSVKRLFFIIGIILFGSFSLIVLKPTISNSGFTIEETPFSVYHLIDGCNTITHSSGSVIVVPENAFDCNDKVIIKYREYRDPYDMIINDIPMHFIKQQKRHQLESGGMFEIKAECNGKEITLNQGKQIQVRYKCDKHIDELKVYKMNEDGRYWEENELEIMEMSFDPENNSSTRPDLWGNQSVQAANQQFFDGEEFGSVLQMDHPYFKGVLKGINISKMGMYNYDAIIKESGVIPIIGAALIVQNKDLDIERLFVIYDSLNTTYYYSKDDLKNRFVIRPNVKAHIFAMLKSGFIATFSMARFNAVNWENLRNKNFSFQLDLNPVKPTKKKHLIK
jgi:hypothetical protein